MLADFGDRFRLRLQAPDGSPPERGGQRSGPAGSGCNANWAEPSPPAPQPSSARSKLPGPRALSPGAALGSQRVLPLSPLSPESPSTQLHGYPADRPSRPGPVGLSPRGWKRLRAASRHFSGKSSVEGARERGAPEGPGDRTAGASRCAARSYRRRCPFVALAASRPRGPAESAPQPGRSFLSSPRKRVAATGLTRFVPGLETTVAASALRCGNSRRQESPRK